MQKSNDDRSRANWHGWLHSSAQPMKEKKHQEEKKQGNASDWTDAMDAVNVWLCSSHPSGDHCKPQLSRVQLQTCCSSRYSNLVWHEHIRGYTGVNAFNSTSGPREHRLWERERGGGKVVTPTHAQKELQALWLIECKRGGRLQKERKVSQI